MHPRASYLLERKASELDVLGKALASFLSYDQVLLSHYKYWSLDHIMTRSLLSDTKLLRNYLKKLSKTQAQEDQYPLLKSIHSITNNIYSYCTGLEYHSKKSKDYLAIYKKELNHFIAVFHKWSSL